MAADEIVDQIKEQFRSLAVGSGYPQSNIILMSLGVAAFSLFHGYKRIIFLYTIAILVLH